MLPSIKRCEMLRTSAFPLLVVGLAVVGRGLVEALPVSGKWTEVEVSMPAPMADFGWSDNGRISYVQGGAASEPVSGVFSYSNGEWSVLKETGPSATRDGYLFPDGSGGLWVAGGWDSDNAVPSSVMHMKSNGDWEEQEDTGDWIATAAGAVVWKEGEVYLFGGETGAGELTSSVWRIEADEVEISFVEIASDSHYKPSDRKWSSGSYAGDNRLLFTGGAGGDGPMGDAWWFNLDSGKWSEAPSIPTQPRSGHAMWYHCAGSSPGVVSYGGEFVDGSSYWAVNDLWYFDLSSETWTELAFVDGPAPEARLGHRIFAHEDSVASCGDKVVVIGGVDWVPSKHFFADEWVLQLL